MGRTPALRRLLRISSFHSALRIDSLSLSLQPAFKSLHSTPLYHRGSSRYSPEKVSRPSVRVTAKQPCFELHCSGIRAWRKGAVFSCARSAVGDLSLRRSALCCGKCAVVDRGSLLFHKTLETISGICQTLSRTRGKLTLELAGVYVCVCIFISHLRERPQPQRTRGFHFTRQPSYLPEVSASGAVRRNADKGVGAWGRGVRSVSQTG